MKTTAEVAAIAGAGTNTIRIRAKKLGIAPAVEHGVQVWTDEQAESLARTPPRGRPRKESESQVNPVAG